MVAFIVKAERKKIVRPSNKKKEKRNNVSKKITRGRIFYYYLFPCINLDSRIFSSIDLLKICVDINVIDQRITIL